MSTPGSRAAVDRPTTALGKILLVVRREFLERVKTKAFIWSTLLVPVILSAVMFAPLILNRISPAKPATIGVIDETGVVYPALDRELTTDKDDDFIRPLRGEGTVRRYQLEKIDDSAEGREKTLDELSARIEDKSLSAYMVIPKGILETGKEPTYYAKNLSNLDQIRRLRRALSEAVISMRLEEKGVAATDAKEILKSVGLETVKVAGGERSKRGAATEFIVTLIYVMFIYTNILLYGSALVRSFIEEKTNRVAEVVLSSMTPFQLMAGKIVGIGSVGLAQFLIWASALMGIYAFRGLSPETSQLFSAIEPWVIGYFVLYFVLGYFLFSTLFCIVGAMSTNEQEAQNSQMPVMMLCIASMLLALSLANRPDSTLAVALSHFPFFSPILMFMRIQVLTPPAWEIILNVLVILATITGMTWVAGRVFRVGILMTGKRATIPEIIRWVRAS